MTAHPRGVNAADLAHKSPIYVAKQAAGQAV